MKHFFMCFGDVLVELEVEIVTNECTGLMLDVHIDKIVI